MPDPATHPSQKWAGPVSGPGSAPIVEDDAAWQQILARIPRDRETRARQTGARARRRGIRSARDLLRVVLMDTRVDWSFRLVGAWASARALAALSDVAVRQRVRRTLPWLQALIRATLAVAPDAAAPANVWGRLVEAPTAQRPGRTGTDWRLHLSFPLAPAPIGGIAVTDAKGGETLARHPTRSAWPIAATPIGGEAGRSSPRAARLWCGRVGRICPCRRRRASPWT